MKAALLRSAVVIAAVVVVALLVGFARYQVASATLSPSDAQAPAQQSMLQPF
jgi:hypothetical protein